MASQITGNSIVVQQLVELTTKEAQTVCITGLLHAVCIIGPLRGEFTGDGWILLAKGQ